MDRHIININRIIKEEFSPLAAKRIIRMIKQTSAGANVHIPSLETEIKYKLGKAVSWRVVKRKCRGRRYHGEFHYRALVLEGTAEVMCFSGSIYKPMDSVEDIVPYYAQLNY